MNEEMAGGEAEGEAETKGAHLYLLRSNAFPPLHHRCSSEDRKQGSYGSSCSGSTSSRTDELNSSEDEDGDCEMRRRKKTFRDNREDVAVELPESVLSSETYPLTLTKAQRRAVRNGRRFERHLAYLREHSGFMRECDERRVLGAFADLDDLKAALAESANTVSGS